AAPRRALTLRRGEEAAHIYRPSSHLNLSINPAPLVTRAVAVDLDPVALGVGEIERLAHQMVALPGQGIARIEPVAQPAPQVGLSGYEDGKVEEACGALRCRGGSRALGQQEDWRSGSTQ